VPASARVGFDVDAAFQRFTVKVGVLDGGRGAVRFKVLGDGKVLASTPPLFPGAAPVELEVSLERVLLLELVTIAEGSGGSRGAWLDGELESVRGADLGPFRAVETQFDERKYPFAFRKRVNESIDSAAKYLLGMQQEDGSWYSRHNRLGFSALMTLACLKAGVPGDDPAMSRAFEFMRPRAIDHTYSVSILLMALEARYFPMGAEPRAARSRIPKKDYEWIQRCATWLTSVQGEWPAPVWRYPHGHYDLSNTQYALFGLAAANRCGVPTGKVWLPALRFLLAAQEKPDPKLRIEMSRYQRKGRYLRRIRERAHVRGFGYTLKGEPTGSMTAAGLASLILCQQALYKNATFKQSFSRKTRTAMRDALAWLEEYYEVDENPFRGRAWWTYYLFNLERCGVLLDQRYIGTRDWYREGAEALLDEQHRDGSFRRGPLDTAFALLFLKRATVASKTTPLK
jgi:hypothetical protein